MKIFLHHLQNDFRCVKSWLMLWFCILALPIIVFAGFFTARGWQRGFWPVLNVALQFLLILQVLVLVILIAKLIQKESPVVSQAYWVTRPISVSHLMLSKLFGVLLWIVLPVLGQYILLRYILQGNLSGELDVFPAVMFWVCITCLLGIVSASLGRNLNQALLIAASIPLIFMVFRSVILLMTGPWFFETGLAGSLLSRPAVSMMFAFVIFLAGAWGGAYGYTHRSRIWRQMLAYSPLLIILFLFEQSIPSLHPPEKIVDLPEGAELNVQNFSYEVQEPSVFGRKNTFRGEGIETWRSAESGDAKGLQGELHWSGLPDHWLRVSDVQYTISPDGTWLTNIPNRLRNSLMRPFDSFQVHETGFPNVSVKRQAGRQGEKVSLFLSPSLDPKNLPFPATFKTTFKTDFYIPKLVEIPFHLHQGFDIPGGSVSVEAVDVMGDNLIIRLRYLNYHTGDTYIDPFQVGGLAVRDPATDEVVFARRSSSSGAGFLNFFSMRDAVLNLPEMGKKADDLSALTFYIVSLEYIGSDLRELEYSVDDD